MITRDELIDLIVKKCENKFDYWEIASECAEMVNFRPIVEFVIDSTICVWKKEDDNAN